MDGFCFKLRNLGGGGNQLSPTLLRADLGWWGWGAGQREGRGSGQLMTVVQGRAEERRACKGGSGECGRERTWGVQDGEQNREAPG